MTTMADNSRKNYETVDEHLAAVETQLRDVVSRHFPRAHAAPAIQKHKWIMPATWDLLAKRRGIINGGHRCAKTYKMLRSQAALKLWRVPVRGAREHHGAALCKTVQSLMRRLLGFTPGVLRDQAWLYNTQPMLKKSLAADRAQYFVSLASKTQRAEDDGDTRLLFKLLAELRLFNPRCLPTLCAAAGDPVADAEADTKLLEEHFADAMCAVEVSSAAKAQS